MSTQESTISCKYPWKLFDYDKASDTVNIRATKGSLPPQDYNDLHVSVLRHRSGFFRNHLDATQTGHSRPAITFAVDNFAVLNAYTTWLYQGRLARSTSPLPASRLFYCQLYAFALRSNTPMLQNAALDEFLLAIDEDNAVRGDLAAYVLQNCAGSRMALLVRDVGCGKKPGVRRALGEMAYPICGRYHVHAEADPRDGELFFVDPPGSGGEVVGWS